MFYEVMCMLFGCMKVSLLLLMNFCGVLFYWLMCYRVGVVVGLVVMVMRLSV